MNCSPSRSALPCTLTLCATLCVRSLRGCSYEKISCWLFPFSVNRLGCLESLDHLLNQGPSANFCTRAFKLRTVQIKNPIRDHRLAEQVCVLTHSRGFSHSVAWQKVKTSKERSEISSLAHVLEAGKSALTAIENRVRMERPHTTMKSLVPQLSQIDRVHAHPVVGLRADYISGDSARNEISSYFDGISKATQQENEKNARYGSHLLVLSRSL